MKNLKNYLNGTMSYFEACAIFSILCSNKRMVAYLLKDDSRKNREKLHYEIKKLLINNKIDWRTEETETIQNPDRFNFVHLDLNQENQSGFIPESKVNSISNKIDDRIKSYYRERGHLHGRLHEAQSDEQRYNIAHQITEVQKRIDALLKDLNLIDQNKVPKEYLNQEATASEFKGVRNAKIYIARYKKELKKTTDPKQQEKLIKLINKHTQKLK